MKNQDSAKIVFNMLDALYKPLEKELFVQLKKKGKEDLIKGYKEMTYAKKIYILDRMAERIGY